jgi:hypothetical protein
MLGSQKLGTVNRGLKELRPSKYDNLLHIVWSISFSAAKDQLETRCSMFLAK